MILDLRVGNPPNFWAELGFGFLQKCPSKNSGLIRGLRILAIFLKVFFINKKSSLYQSPFFNLLNLNCGFGFWVPKLRGFRIANPTQPIFYKGLGAFVGEADRVSMVSVQDPGVETPTGYNQNKAISVWGEKNR